MQTLSMSSRLSRFFKSIINNLLTSKGSEQERSFEIRRRSTILPLIANFHSERLERILRV